MNVKTLCLAILYDADVTGYDIRKLSTDGEYAYFIDASYGSIYPALAGLEADGMVQSRVERQSGRPDRKVYSITDAGRQKFHSELFAPLDSDLFRSEFLLFARFAALLPASLVQTRLAEQIAEMDRKLDDIKRLQDDQMHDGDRWISRYGISCLEYQRDYLVTHAKDLIALAKPDAKAAE